MLIALKPLIEVLKQQINRLGLQRLEPAIRAIIQNHLAEDGRIGDRGEQARMARHALQRPGVFIVDDTADRLGATHDVIRLEFLGRDPGIRSEGGALDVTSVEEGVAHAQRGGILLDELIERLARDGLEEDADRHEVEIGVEEGRPGGVAERVVDDGGLALLDGLVRGVVQRGVRAGGEARRVGEEHLERDVFLAVCCKVGQVGGDGGVEGETPGVELAQGGYRREDLGQTGHVVDGVWLGLDLLRLGEFRAFDVCVEQHLAGREIRHNGVGVADWVN